MDNQAFFNKFGNVSEIMADTLMICEGMDAARGDIGEKAYNTLAIGIFGILAHTMNAAYCKMSELDSEFYASHNVKWPVQMDEDERKQWASERGRS